MPKRFARNQRDNERLTIVAHDHVHKHLIAHYNPKEVQIDKAVKWDAKPTHAGTVYLEFGGSEGRSVSLELLLDCFEDAGEDLEHDLHTLQRMALPIDDAGKPWQRRPPILTLLNGPIPGYRCVMESLSIKVVMFGPRGKPVRAVVNVKFKEVRRDREGYLIAAAGSTKTVEHDDHGRVKVIGSNAGHRRSR